MLMKNEIMHYKYDGYIVLYIVVICPALCKNKIK